MVKRATIDFESRSACSLKKCGSWRYSCDPTTEVLCLAFRLPHWPEGETALWHPAFPQFDIPEGCEEGPEVLAELFAWILEGNLVEAHNAWFERGIWTNISIPKYGWPAIAPRQWRCSASKSAAHALPRALEHAIAALHVEVLKDIEGAKVMKKMAKPRKPRKKELEVWTAKHGRRPMPTLYHENIDLLVTLWDYCRQDILAEEALSHALPDLDDHEMEYYLMDQMVNERGFRLDKDAYQAALYLIAAESKLLNAELREITGGAVERATQRDRMKAWCESKGVVLPDTQAATIDVLLGVGKDMLGDTSDPDDLPTDVRKALEILRALGRSSTAKYETMRFWLCGDHRVHGGLLFHGASTGRWTGAGVQPHNFPKGKLKDDDDEPINMEALWLDIKTRNRATLIAKYGTVMEALSYGLRGAIVASPGKWLYVADYAAIEARVLLWLAEDEEALDIFRRGEDIYCWMASDIYGYPCNKKDHPNERALGKVAVLGLGYQMGWSKFIDTCMTMAKIEIDDDLAQTTVTAYREKFWRVKQMWADQEQAAIRAARSGKTITCGPVSWVKRGIFLYCVLPSSRCLAYPFPEVRMKETPWGEMKPSLSFMSVNPKTRKWTRQTTYGGSIVENITQAVARDLMAEAMLRCEQSLVYQPVLSVHDELIAEGHPVLGDVKAFEALMSEVPEWAEGCPVETEGWAGERYRKWE